LETLSAEMLAELGLPGFIRKQHWGTKGKRGARWQRRKTLGKKNPGGRRGSGAGKNSGLGQLMPKIRLRLQEVMRCGGFPSAN